MSHEIRTPLGAVLGFSELLADHGLPESERLEYVAAIKRNAELLSNVINDILDLSKVEAGRLNVEMQQVPINQVLSDVSTLLSLQAEVEDAHDNQMLIGRFLELAGATVAIAENGLESLEMAENGAYDVLLMDLQMPDMDGYEATATLRKQGYKGPIVIRESTQRRPGLCL